MLFDKIPFEQHFSKQVLPLLCTNMECGYVSRGCWVQPVCQDHGGVIQDGSHLARGVCVLCVWAQLRGGWEGRKGGLRLKPGQSDPEPRQWCPAWLSPETLIIALFLGWNNNINHPHHIYVVHHQKKIEHGQFSFPKQGWRKVASHGSMNAATNT